MSDTAGSKNTMMVSFQDADIAGCAVPGPGRCHRFAGCAEAPAFQYPGFSRGDDYFPGACIAENCEGQVAYDVEHEEVTEEDIDTVFQTAVGVESWHDYENLEPVEKRNDYKNERY